MSLITLMPSARRIQRKPARFRRFDRFHAQIGDCVSWWLLNDIDSNVVDVVSGFDGTLTDGPTWNVGKFGTALNFNGTSAYVALPCAPLSFPAPGSVTLWVRSTSDTAQTVFSVSRSGTPDDRWQISVGNGATGTLTNELITVARIRNSITYIIGYTTSARGELFDGAWHHIAVVCNGVSVLLYLDGIECTLSLGSGSNNGTFTNVFGVNSASIASLISNGGARGSFFNGTVDDVRVYRKALSLIDI